MLGILQAIFTPEKLVRLELIEIENLSNCLIAFAYYSIFLTVIYLVSQRQNFSSPVQLEPTNRELEREISDRQQAEKALRQSEQMILTVT